jgi:hypothetical protein
MTEHGKWEERRERKYRHIQWLNAYRRGEMTNQKLQALFRRDPSFIEFVSPREKPNEREVY